MRRRDGPFAGAGTKKDNKWLLGHVDPGWCTLLEWEVGDQTLSRGQHTPTVLTSRIFTISYDLILYWATVASLQ